MSSAAARRGGEEARESRRGAAAWRAQVTYVRQAGGAGLQGTPASLLAELLAALVRDNVSMIERLTIRDRP